MTLAIALTCLIVLGIVLAIAVLERPPPIQDTETLPQESDGSSLSSDQCRYAHSLRCCLHQPRTIRGADIYPVKAQNYLGRHNN